MNSGFIGLPVEVCVEDFRLGVEAGFQRVDLVHPQEARHGARRRVEVAEDPGLRRAYFNARRELPLRDPVVAEGALVGGVGHRVEVPRAVRARLDAIPAPDAVSYTHLTLPT